MNEDQFRLILKEVFEKLQASGLDISSDVYILIMKLFTDFKLNQKTREEAIDSAVFYFQQCRELSKKLEELTLINQQLRG